MKRALVLCITAAALLVGCGRPEVSKVADCTPRGVERIESHVGEYGNEQLVICKNGRVYRVER